MVSESLTECEGSSDTPHLGVKLADKEGTGSCLQDPQPRGHWSTSEKNHLILGSEPPASGLYVFFLSFGA